MIGSRSGSIAEALQRSGVQILPGPFLLMGNYVLNSFPLGLQQTQQ
jgi:hypothetical protein